jgi:hypothetical protein
MKALGIPNNKDFFEVTRIADAQQLWKAIQVRLLGAPRVTGAWPCVGVLAYSSSAPRAGGGARLRGTWRTRGTRGAQTPATRTAVAPKPRHTRAHAASQERQTGGFNPEMDEELEDAAGNVYSRKVYEDLKRQGLL